MSIYPLAGKKAPKSMLINISRLISAYYNNRPDSNEPRQRVAFGTSGQPECKKNPLRKQH